MSDVIETIELTKEMILAAKSYIPLGIKDAWVADCSAKCFDRLAITADGEQMPPMYMVNASLKSRYLMGAFVGFYLCADYMAESEDNKALMSMEDYDKWAGSHIFNQLERWKRDADVKDKCFDILSDYRVLEKRFGLAINSLLTVQNDQVIRQNDLVKNQIMQEMPELLKGLQELQELKGKEKESTQD